MAKKIEMKRLQGIIKALEQKDEYPNLGALFTAAVDAYNAGKITKDQIAVHDIRNNQEDLTFKTKGKKGKTSTPVDMKLLEESLLAVEKDGGLTNRSALWVAVAEHYNSHKAENEKEITHSIANLRITATLLEKVTTPVGRRGVAAGGTMSDEHKAALLAGRKDRGVKAKPVFWKLHVAAVLQANSNLKREFVLKALHKRGNRMKAKLRCLSCADCKAAIKGCTAFDCSDWADRPYQPKTEAEFLAASKGGDALELTPAELHEIGIIKPIKPAEAA